MKKKNENPDNEICSDFNKNTVTAVEVTEDMMIANDQLKENSALGLDAIPDIFLKKKTDVLIAKNSDVTVDSQPRWWQCSRFLAWLRHHVQRRILPFSF